MKDLYEDALYSYIQELFEKHYTEKHILKSKEEVLYIIQMKEFTSLKTIFNVLNIFLLVSFLVFAWEYRLLSLDRGYLFLGGVFLVFITLVRFSVISIKIKEKLKHNYLKYVFEDYLPQKMKEFQGIRKCITHISLPNDNKNKKYGNILCCCKQKR